MWYKEPYTSNSQAENKLFTLIHNPGGQWACAWDRDIQYNLYEYKMCNLANGCNVNCSLWDKKSRYVLSLRLWLVHLAISLYSLTIKTFAWLRVNMQEHSSHFLMNRYSKWAIMHEALKTHSTVKSQRYYIPRPQKQ